MNHPAWQAFQSSAPHNPDLSNLAQFTELANRLVSHQPFQVARYNDGEWVFMLQTAPYYAQYMKRSKYSYPEVNAISQKLLAIIDSKPTYFIGIDSTTLAGVGTISPDYASFQKRISGLNLVYGEIFNAATVMRGISALTAPLKDRRVLTVGPDYMKKLKWGEHHVTVPSRSCWSEEARVVLAVAENPIK